MQINVKVKKSPLDFFKKGDRVVRNDAHWEYNQQDCDDNGRPGEGTVIEIIKGNLGDHPLRIRWDNGNANVYKINSVVKVKSLS